MRSRFWTLILLTIIVVSVDPFIISEVDVVHVFSGVLFYLIWQSVDVEGFVVVGHLRVSSPLVVVLVSGCHFNGDGLCLFNLKF